MAQSYKNHENKKSDIIVIRHRTKIRKAWGSTGSGRKNFLDFLTKYIYLSYVSSDLQLTSFQSIVKMVWNGDNCKYKYIYDNFMGGKT